jgi:tRNA(fMet)-specific endonuclease VapC
VAKRTHYLLDSSILLHLVRGKALGEYIKRAYEFASLPARPLISIVSHGELLAMAERRSWGAERRAALDLVLAGMVTVDLNDPAILRGYVAVDLANVKFSGGSRVLSNNDAWIAATAHASGALLLTTDKDFLHLHPGVCSVEYIDPASRLPGS